MQQKSQKAQSTKQSKKQKSTSKKTPIGLGDTVEQLIPTPIKKAVQAIAGEDCGCAERKKRLNSKFSYVNLFSEEDKKLWEDVLKPQMYDGAQWGVGTQGIVQDLYERTFRFRFKKTKCGACVMDRMRKLEAVYEASCES